MPVSSSESQSQPVRGLRRAAAWKKRNLPVTAVEDLMILHLFVAVQAAY